MSTTGMIHSSDKKDHVAADADVKSDAADRGAYYHLFSAFILHTFNKSFILHQVINQLTSKIRAMADHMELPTVVIPFFFGSHVHVPLNWVFFFW